VTTIPMSGKDAKLLALVVCSVGAILAINLLYFPLSVPWMLQNTGGVPYLDMVPGRSADKTYEILAELGTIGRRNHLYFIWTIDLALPLLFGSCLYVAIRDSATRAFGASSTAGRLRWLAVAAASVDYLENISNSVLLVFYPDRFPFLASMSGLLTLMKFSLSGVCSLIALSMFSISFAGYRKTKT
jgi:hypothetical protein